MAFIRFKNGQSRVVSPEQGALIWQIMNGEAAGTLKQRQFCAKVARVYLNAHRAPSNYRTWLKQRTQLAEAGPVWQMNLPYKDS